MRNTSFFEKLTGSLRLSDEDLKALNETDGASAHAATATAPISAIPQTSSTQDGDTIIEEVVDDFEVPEGTEVETVEEVVEDESIDSEQVDEYYEEIIDEEEPTPIVVQPSYTHQEPETTEEEIIPEEVEEDYPIFNMNSQTEEAQEEPEEEELIDFTPRATSRENRPARPSLPIDMYELHHEIIIRTLVPGITPEHLKVSITRDHVSIAGTRPAPDGIPNDNYFEREVEWGEFSRMIELPTEVDVEHAEAVEKYGLLVIRLPKIDSMKTQELKVKSV